MCVEGHKTREVRLRFDTAALLGQLNEPIELLKTRFPEGIPNQIISDIQGLSFDIVLSNYGSAVIADGTVEVLQGLRFGSRCEDFRAALLAGKFRVHEASNSIPFVR
jgi:hypothetical protein